MNKPKWEHAPTWANYIAQETDEMWYWYECEPVWCNKKMQWTNPNNGTMKLADNVDVARNSKEEKSEVHIFTKVIATALLPKLVEEVYGYIKSQFDDAPKPEVKSNVKRRKPVDATKITKGMIEYAEVAYDEWVRTGYIKGQYIRDLSEFTDHCNSVFGTHKTRTAIRKLTNGHYNNHPRIPQGDKYE